LHVPSLLFPTNVISLFHSIFLFYLYIPSEDPIHILLKCSETRKWREQFLRRKWLRLNEWIVFKKINCTNSIESRNIGSYLYKIKLKLENKIRNLSSELGSSVVVIS
jgi:hypothetical protein